MGAHRRSDRAAGKSATRSRPRPDVSSSRSTPSVPTRNSPRSSTFGERRTTAAPQTFLEANCLFPGGTARAVCGDWVPLGVVYPFLSGTTPRVDEPQAGRFDERFLRHESGRGTHRRRRAHAGRRRHALGGDELRPAVRFEERGRAPAPTSQFVRIDTADHAQSLRHPHRRRSDESERRDHFVFGLQRVDAGDAWPHLPRGATIRRRNARRSRRSTSTWAICRSTRSPSTTCAAISTPALISVRWCCARATASWTLAGVGFPGSADGRSGDRARAAAAGGGDARARHLLAHPARNRQSANGSEADSKAGRDEHAGLDAVAIEEIRALKRRTAERRSTSRSTRRC